MEIRKLTTLEEKVQAQKISTLAFVFPADMEKEAERLRQLPESSEEYQVERWGAFLPDGFGLVKVTGAVKVDTIKTDVAIEETV